MNLLEATPGTIYTITMLCDEVMMTDRGLIPGEYIMLNKIQGGLVWFTLGDESSYMMREKNAKCIKIE